MMPIKMTLLKSYHPAAVARPVHTPHTLFEMDLLSLCLEPPGARVFLLILRPAEGVHEALP